MTTAQRVLHALRLLLEIGVVAGLARWGYRAAGGGGNGTLLAILAPTIGFGIWGAVDSHQTGRFAEPLRLAEEPLVSSLAAAGLIAVGPNWSGWTLLGLSIFYHLLVYASGERLLKERNVAGDHTTAERRAAGRPVPPTVGGSQSRPDNPVTDGAATLPQLGGRHDQRHN